MSWSTGQLKLLISLRMYAFKSEISTVIAIWFADGGCRGARVKGGD